MLTLLKPSQFSFHTFAHMYSLIHIYCLHTHTHLEWYNTLHIYTIQVNNTCKVGHNNKCNTLYKVGPESKNSDSLNWLGVQTDSVSIVLLGKFMHSRLGVHTFTRYLHELGTRWILTLPWTLGKFWLLRSLGKHSLPGLPWSLGRSWWLGKHWLHCLPWPFGTYWLLGLPWLPGKHWWLGESSVSIQNPISVVTNDKIVF